MIIHHSYSCKTREDDALYKLEVNGNLSLDIIGVSNVDSLPGKTSRFDREVIM